MSEIILDMGSGNSCHNSIDYACKMIDAVAAIDSHKHEVIFKWQLFSNEPPNLPLDHLVFSRAYSYAEAAGYKTTSSVFDTRSLDFLLNFEIPFVKIACRPKLYWLAGEVPRKIPLYVSEYKTNIWREWDWGYKMLFCVPQYPAPPDEYMARVDGCYISDHTIGLDIFKTKHPAIWEKHFILEDDPKNPDAAGHAIKPDLLKEVIG